MFFVGILFCVIFGFILICNLIFIVKSHFQSDAPPAVFGITPMIVQSGSMSGTIEVDDLIFIGSVEVEKLQTGDIVAFRSGNRIVSHRIVEIQSKEGGRLFLTKGDANNIEDDWIVENQIVGKYLGRIPKLGGFIVFLQSPLGITLIILVTALGFLAFKFSIPRRSKRERVANSLEIQSQEEEN